MREWVEEPIAYRIEYIDGTKATMLMMNGLVGDFTLRFDIFNVLDADGVREIWNNGEQAFIGEL